MRRMFAYLVSAGLLAGLGLLAVAAPASAHAVLESSSPADGAVLGHAPARVSAMFDEPVGIIVGSLQVFAPNGNRVDTGQVTHGGRPQQIAVALLRGLGPGTYTVSWHVISADSHPVQGAYTFSVGAPSSTSVHLAGLGGQESALVGFAFWAVRWLAFWSFAVMIGAVAFVVCCWPAGAADPRVLRLTMGAWGGLALSVLAAVLLEGVYGAGQGLGHVFWPNVLHTTLYSRYGRAVGARLLLVVIALFAFSLTLGSLPEGGRRSRATAGAVWGALTVAFAATWAVADHSGVGSQVPLAVPADIVHLSAMAVWLGGLAMLIAIVLRPARPRARAGVGAQGGNGRAAERGARMAAHRGQVATAQAAQAVTSFSPIALGCVVALVVTGTYQAWRNVGTWGALAGTSYGRLLLVKIAAMCALIALGYLARRRIAEGLRAPLAAETAVEDDGAPLSRARVIAGVLSGSVGVRSAVAAVLPGAAARPATARPLTNGAAARAMVPATRWGSGGAGNGGPVNGRQANGAQALHEGANGVHPVSGAGLDHGRAAVSLARLRFSVTIEAVIALVVLAATAVLVNTPTGRESYTPPASASVPFDTGGPGGRGVVSATVTPAQLGPDQVRLRITSRTGAPYRAQQVQATLSLPARHLGPLTVPLRPDGPGRYLSGPVTITLVGQWQLMITVRSDAFDETTVSVPVPVH
jgi:copper transport protein